MENKKKLIERLIKEGNINLDEAILLLDIEQKQIVINQPYQPQPLYPWQYPSTSPYWYGQHQITC